MKLRRVRITETTVNGTIEAEYENVIYAEPHNSGLWFHMSFQDSSAVYLPSHNISVIVVELMDPVPNPVQGRQRRHT